eukprot:CAMPEP_0185695460 /NCGR_PEP_ID=MMETSP1164-20130828/4537_1 /TAXON_ID=1104430 /ORGANISM="Chrysoreinhardia sp, Strain CCMP2950" /LENGTH=334 /DNA_ID=CAMNT_0028362319 /DNA_START=1 /DNA_END=1005 /DNA_ORIENTATION=+
MAVEVYHEALCRRYYAARWSFAYAFVVLVAATLVVVPFFVAYTNVPSFWLKTNTYREQPTVQYEYKVLGLLEGRDASTGLPWHAYYSSLGVAEARLFRDALRVPVLRSIEVDQNRDGLADRFQLEALVPVAADEHVYASRLVVFFDVKLRKRARLEMETVAYVAHDAGLPGRAVFVDGDYVLRQTWPLRAKGGFALPYENTPLLDGDHPTDVTYVQTLLPRLLASYRARNTTMDFRSFYEVWSPSGAVEGADVDQSSSHFNLTLNLRIPTADVLYTPTASEVLKDAWIKYLSIFVVVAFLLDRLCAFVFYYQLVETTMRVETSHSRHGDKPKSL